MAKYDLDSELDSGRVEVVQSVDISQFPELRMVNLIHQIMSQDRDSPWGIKTGGSIGSRPLEHDGIVYFGANDHNFYAVDEKTGKELWRFGTGGIVSAWSSAAVWRDRLLFTCFDKNVYCISLDGKKLIWKFGTSDKIACTPLIYNDLVIFGSKDKNLYAVSANSGKEVWRVSLAHEIVSHPLAHRGYVYIGSRGGIHKISPKGRLIWNFHVPGDVDSGLGASGEFLFFGCTDRNVYCITTKGGFRWKYPTQGPIISDAVVNNGRVYIGSFDYNMYCLDFNGNLLWRFETDDIVSTGFVFGDRIYFPSFGRHIYCLNSDGKLLWKHPLERIAYILVTKMGVYAGSWNCKLYALSKEGKLLWEFPTSLGYPSDVEFEPFGEISLTVIHPQEQKGIQRKGKDIHDIHVYGEIGSQYIEMDKRDYIGEPLDKEGFPRMAYKRTKEVYRK